ncbi:GPALPP motifs-containing protein 1 [Anopheles nili]|uniref:GPALPP motifs-containing protein 1 n=1 Tax=Anopheles nili TaxID=185578 RepID=UPI00237B41D9|nr:GPALPP motifs-containing protein 1 [Anopheles nili]
MSDSDTTDSDCGVRYKTTTTRHKHAASTTSSAREQKDHSSYREGSSSRQPDRRRYRRSRSKTPDRRRHRRRSRSIDTSPRARSTHRPSRSRYDESPRKDVLPEKVLDISVSSVSSQDEQPEQQQSSQRNASSAECFGPALPPSLGKSSTRENRTSDVDETPQDDIIGPALPPHLLGHKSEQAERTTLEKRSIGPSLPPGFTATTSAPSNDHISSDSELSPFSEPADEHDEDDDDIIGPLPGSSSSRANLDLEQRALEIKIRQLEESSGGTNGKGLSLVPKAREDWMLELPDVRKVSDLGLGARQFRTREKPEIGDRSVWTDTPADRERKKNATGSDRSSKKIDPAAEREREREQKLTAKRDQEQERLVKQHKKKHKRDKTLLEIHESKLQKEKDEAGVSSESVRRPFDRNVDLHANRFDDAQKKAIMKKAQLLNSRFSSGSSKYL